MKPLIIIPARGGSKGIKKKNIRLFNGKPLIYYTVNLAQKVFSNKNICLSTDDLEIKNLVESYGLKVPFLRPKEISTDKSPSIEFILHALEFYQKKVFSPDTIILLQPTSPLKTKNHLIEAFELFKKNKTKYDILISCFKSKSNPYFNLLEKNMSGELKISKISKFTRRQDCPDILEINGAIYIMKVSSILKTKNIPKEKILAYEMDYYSSVDIDNEFDWEIAEYIFKKKYSDA